MGLPGPEERVASRPSQLAEQATKPKPKSGMKTASIAVHCTLELAR